MWSWERPGHEVFMAKFDFHGSTGAVVAFVFSDPQFLCHLLILKLNLTTGNSRELLALETGTLSPSGLRICGDYFACHVVNQYSVLLIDWRAGQFILFGAFYAQSWLTLCLGGHLILAYNAANIPPHVRLYPFSLFDGLWRPMSGLDLDSRINATEIHPSISLELPSNAPSGESNHSHITVTLLESPMHADTYELIAEVVDFVVLPSAGTPFRRRFTRLLSLFWRSNAPRSPTTPTILRVTWSRHLLTLPKSPSTPPRFTCKYFSRHSALFSSTSGVGYGLRYAGAKVLVERLGSGEGTEPLELSISDGNNRLPRVVLTHSGAILAIYSSKVVVYHYQ
ncbi:hypothetical protein DFH08DRAFT_248482 [Mycena albidolilacea]|uniref:Uncharacterized protein n=1 Tax=Mycena albidolilacea TaxID=1033008 RepID=A0AAD6ZUF1_9AGAR|nr:hypothetical protein DFH08DRAFT_248482 [Mycena albidolilacea]